MLLLLLLLKLHEHWALKPTASPLLTNDLDRYYYGTVKVTRLHTLHSPANRRHHSEVAEVVAVVPAPAPAPVG